MRTITPTINEHGILQFVFDPETARATGVAAFSMTESAGIVLGERLVAGDFDKASPFIGIVHDGGDIVIELQSIGGV